MYIHSWDFLELQVTQKTFQELIEALKVLSLETIRTTDLIPQNIDVSIRIRQIFQLLKQKNNGKPQIMCLWNIKRDRKAKCQKALQLHDKAGVISANTNDIGT